MSARSPQLTQPKIRKTQLVFDLSYDMKKIIVSLLRKQSAKGATSSVMAFLRWHLRQHGITTQRELANFMPPEGIQSFQLLIGILHQEESNVGRDLLPWWVSLFHNV